MQDTLSIKTEKKTIVSKPFDFATMCMVNEKHNDEKVKGPLNMCKDAVDYMFEGTEATQEVIDNLSVNVRAKLCLAVWNMYIDALTAKNE